MMEELPFKPWKATSQFSRNRQKLISFEHLSGLLFEAANDCSTILTLASIAEIFFASIWATFDTMTFQAEISSSHYRSPLTPLPIAQNERIRPTTPSPPYGTVKPAIQRTLRHKPSLRAFNPHVDSSESSIPSAHSSIYEASLTTPPLDDTVPENSRSFEFPSIPLTTIPPASDISTPIYPDSNTLRLPESVQNSQLFAANTVHQPHVLAPISERPSASTLRTSISTYRARSPSLPLPLPPLNSESSTPSSRSNSPLNLAAPSPHLPRVSPPHRSPTPPGLPSFGSAAAVNYRLPPPRKRRRDRLRPATRQELEWRAQTVGLPRGVVMRGDEGILIRGRFRHGDGGMGLGMESRPWNRRDFPSTGVAGSNANRVNNAHGVGHINNTLRRSGPASSNLGLARQIEVANAQQASRRPPPHSRGAVPGNCLHEHESGQERRNREVSMGRWGRVWEKACLVCCGTEVEEGGAEMMQVRIVDMAGDGANEGRSTRRDYREGEIARPAL